MTLNERLDELAREYDKGLLTRAAYLKRITSAFEAHHERETDTTVGERKPIQYIVSTPPHASPSYFHNRIWQLECLNKGQAATIQNLTAELRRLELILDRIVVAHEALTEVVEEARLSE
jgi:hypothetical protein